LIEEIKILRYLYSVKINSHIFIMLELRAFVKNDI